VWTEANILRTRNVTRGDRGTIDLPMIPEAGYARLACSARGVPRVLAGFSRQSAQRIPDANPKPSSPTTKGCAAARNAAEGNVDASIAKTSGVDWVVVVKRTGAPSDNEPLARFSCVTRRRQDGDDRMPLRAHACGDRCHPYTSGSTASPRAAATPRRLSGVRVDDASLVFDYNEGDIYCAPDVGWVNGHSYILYGPLANGRGPTLMFEGVPNYLNNSRFWTRDRDSTRSYFYTTAPTAIRALMQAGDERQEKTSTQESSMWAASASRSYTEAWEWYQPRGRRREVPDRRRYLVADRERRHLTRRCAPQKSSPVRRPTVFGVVPRSRCRWQGASGEAQGHLCIAKAWAGMMSTVMAITPALSRLIYRPTRGRLHRRRMPPRRRKLLMASPGASTTSSPSPATAWAPPKSKSSLVAHAKSLGGSRREAYRMDIKGRASTPM